ncbi:cupin domain-containing protein [Leucobacter coleopterorum]|uniref:Cupin domain-containing protein n=1 Tax=Leucobacter coleopterorum TaxID=2714933 RepID=A0ABX6K1W0_9MICO|nr:cupin domain-containing protein [Leucobacter coleopterorum]QIM19237.1 cupin domain-containing protein [Leucobacter coleopterorum]
MSEVLVGGVNARVNGLGIEVALEAVPASDVVSGSPRQGFAELGSIGGCETGIWELRSGTVVDTEVDEIFVVLSGGATIEFLDEDRSVEVGVGDVMRLVAGSRTRWTVEDHIRKVYIAGQ